VLKCNYMSKPANIFFQNADVNFTFLFEIVTFGIPCSLKLSFINMLEICMVQKLDYTSMK